VRGPESLFSSFDPSECPTSSNPQKELSNLGPQTIRPYFPRNEIPVDVLMTNYKILGFLEGKHLFGLVSSEKFVMILSNGYFLVLELLSENGPRRES